MQDPHRYVDDDLRVAKSSYPNCSIAAQLLAVKACTASADGCLAVHPVAALQADDLLSQVNQIYGTAGYRRPAPQTG